jgi:hypothetical protein
MGWGEIAHELGVHPSTLGLGHKNRERAEVASMGVGKERAAVASAPGFGKSNSRDVKTGVARTPGVAAGQGEKSVGLSRASSKAKSGAKGSESSNSASASGGRGNSGNSGKGGGNSGGNGKGGGNSGGNGKGGGNGKS